MICVERLLAGPERCFQVAPGGLPASRPEQTAPSSGEGREAVHTGTARTTLSSSSVQADCFK